ncbi:MAG: hypothetical protein HQK54_09145 [Oligoflexales bacterium]|nr:hypothetical protein [Oligoflexales bacterium]
MGLEYYKHKKNNKIYLLVSESENGDLKLIFPDGMVRNIATNVEQYDHFEGPYELMDEEIRANLSHEDILRFEKEQLSRRENLLTRINYLPDVGRAKASWHSNRLTFFKDKIDKLHDHDFFECLVDKEGSFVIRKDFFLQKFKAIIESDEYKNQGVFHCDEIPQVAWELKRDQDTRKQLEIELEEVDSILEELDDYLHKSKKSA